MPYRGAEDNEIEIDTSNLMVKEDAHVAFVNQSGDSMSGILNMQFNPIVNLPTPIRAGDVANKDYVDIANRNKVVLQDIDNKIATYFMLKDAASNKKKIEFHHQIDLKGEKISNVAIPTEENDVVTKGYVDCQSRIYDFTYTVNTSSTLYEFTLRINAREDVDPNRMFLYISSNPFFISVDRASTEKGTNIVPSATFELIFRPVSQRVRLNGFIYVSNSDTIHASDSNRVINLR